MPNTFESSFPFRLAAIDLDDTLLGPTKTISPENIQAIRNLQDAGLLVILASGRRHENMLRYHDELKLNGPIVSCQGALVKETMCDEILHRQCMPVPFGKQIVAEGLHRGVTQVYYHLKGTFVTTKNRWTDLYDERTGTKTQQVDSLTEFDADEPLKLLWVAEAGDITHCYKEMNERNLGKFESVITDSEYLEFMAMGVTKSIGVAAAATSRGIAPEHVITFGDGNNDVTMLKWAGMGVAMDHGRASAREAADLVAPEGDPASSFARGVQLAFSKYAL